jgi:hypothetical protein
LAFFLLNSLLMKENVLPKNLQSLLSPEDQRRLQNYLASFRSCPHSGPSACFFRTAAQLLSQDPTLLQPPTEDYQTSGIP